MHLSVSHITLHARLYSCALARDTYALFRSEGSLSRTSQSSHMFTYTHTHTHTYSHTHTHTNTHTYRFSYSQPHLHCAGATLGTRHASGVSTPNNYRAPASAELPHLAVELLQGQDGVCQMHGLEVCELRHGHSEVLPQPLLAWRVLPAG